MMRWSGRKGDMQGGRCKGAVPFKYTGSKIPSEIPCRVRHTCPAAPRGAAEYRLISGKPYRPWPRVIPREVLGPPSDPVTTDPKGEADRAVVKSGKLIDLQYAGPHQDKAAYGVLAAGST